jgi:hypothetical protein
VKFIVGRSSLVGEFGRLNFILSEFEKKKSVLCFGVVS